MICKKHNKHFDPFISSCPDCVLNKEPIKKKDEDNEFSCFSEYDSKETTF